MATTSPEPSGLTAPRPAVVPPPDYTPDEAQYLGRLQGRLTHTRLMRERQWDEFDGMTYTRYCEENRKAANSYIKPRDNPQETNFVTGTTRQKLLGILSAVMNLDLGPDVEAFDEDNHLVQQLGDTMEDIIEETEELDGDEEKKLQRFYTMAEQGTVFVEEIWECEQRKVKKYKGDIRSYAGQLSGAEWTERLQKTFEGPRRNVLKNENVYLGDYTQFYIRKQPYIYTAEIQPYEATKAIFGQWPRWQNVPRRRTNIQAQPTALYNQNWTLLNPEDESCEILRYQDPWNDEYQVLINGVMMLPVGFPLPWRWGGFNLDKQIWELISNHFALGKSLCARLRVKQGLADEMMRLAVLKTQKSFLPPRANNTGKVLSSRVFYPGKVTAGIDPNKLPILEPNQQGLTNGEVQMLELLSKGMDDESIGPAAMGQSAPGAQTATEVLTIKQQAEKMLGLTVFAAASLEKKLAHLRIQNILENWFDPVSQKLDEVRQYLKNRYRQIARTKSIDGVGTGLKVLRLAPPDQTPAPQDIMSEEDQLSATLDMPVRISYADPDILKNYRFEWRIEVKPREKKTSDLRKALWDQFLQRMQMFPNAAWDYLGERTAEIWEENPAKVFTKSQPAMPDQPPAPGAPESPTPQSSVPAVPQLKNQATMGNMAKTGTL